MPAFRLACLAYLSVALPGSTLGLLWPSMRLSFDVPVGALGFLLAFGLIASVISSAATGRILSRVRAGPILALGTMLSALALAVEALAPSLRVFTGGIVLFGLGFGAMDSILNAHAASHFGARDTNWMHASYGLGATIGPLLVTALLTDGLTWRWVYGIIAIVQLALAWVFTVASAVAGVTLGAALMAASGPGILAVIGIMVPGLAAAPIFPLLTLTAAQRVGDTAGTTRTVSLQVAASAVGGTALPAGLGLAIGASSARVLAPLLLVLGLAMCGVYGLMSRLAWRHHADMTVNRDA